MKLIEKSITLTIPYGFSSSIAARMCKDFIYWVGASNNRSRFGKRAGFTILGIRSGKRIMKGLICNYTVGLNRTES